MKYNIKYILELQNEANFVEFTNAVQSAHVLWKHENNMGDKKGAQEIDTIVSDNTENIKDPIAWDIYANSLDTNIYQYIYCEPVKKEIDNFITIPTCNEFKINRNQDSFLDEIFIQDIDFPEVFSSSEKIREYEEKEKIRRDAETAEKSSKESSNNNLFEMFKRQFQKRKKESGSTSSGDSDDDILNQILGAFFNKQNEDSTK
jgi:hypothetical protein